MGSHATLRPWSGSSRRSVAALRSELAELFGEVDTLLNERRLVPLPREQVPDLSE